MKSKKESRKEDYLKHRERYIERATEWNNNNLEKHKESVRRCQENMMKDPERHERRKENARKCYWKDPEHHRKMALESMARLKKKVYDHYGHTCACCGETNPKLLTIDHINNDGAKHRKEIYPKNFRSAGGSHLYRWLLKNNFPEGFQILCWNCNCGKKVNGGVCPHKTEEVILKYGSTGFTLEETETYLA